MYILTYQRCPFDTVVTELFQLWYIDYTCLLWYIQTLELTSLNNILNKRCIKGQNDTPSYRKAHKVTREDTRLLSWEYEPAISLSICSLSALLSNGIRKLHKGAWFNRADYK